MFFPAFSTVFRGSLRLPFFRPGDLLCYCSAGSVPSFYVIEEITTDKIRFSARDHDEYGRHIVPTRIFLLAIRREHLGSQGALCAEPRPASLADYRRVVSSL